MTPTSRLSTLRAMLWPVGAAQAKRWVVVGAAATAFALIGVFALAPPAPPSAADRLSAYIAAHAQTLTVSERAAVVDIGRARYSATPGLETLAVNGTNYDWASLVLLSGGWPMSEANVTVIVRWMRQENGPSDWWNRNNPLNNGWGSGGGGGTGTYPNLMVAAQMAAQNLQRNPGFRSIAASFAASAPTQATEQAIWASPWASGHYANGAHWHYTPVPVVKAPPDAW